MKMDVSQFVTVLLVSMCGSVSCTNIDFKTCGPVTYQVTSSIMWTRRKHIQSKIACQNPQNIKSVDITPCDKQPCVFKHGINVTVKVDFIAAEGSNTLDAEIYGILAGIPVKFNMPNPNGCNMSGLECPIKPSMEYVYSSEFFVLKTYPSLRLAVQWDLKADDGKYIFCFTFPMEIVP